MQETRSSLRKKRKVFGWLFIVSSCVFIVPDMLSQLLHHNMMQGSFFMQKMDSLLSRFQYSSKQFMDFNMAVLSGLMTFLLVIISFIGFVQSSISLWLHDKRAELFKLEESQKLESILASLELEIDQASRR